MMLRSLTSMIVLGLVLGPAVMAQSAPLVVHVDCDAGDDLGKFVFEAQLDAHRLGSPYVTVYVSGTCEANLLITIDNLQLRGEGGEPATIQGSPDLQGTPVLDARNVRGLYLRDLEITGSSTGILLTHSQALILDCRIRGNGTGLEAEGSTTSISRSRIEQNRDGIFLFGSGHMLLQDSFVVENTQTGVFSYGCPITIGSGEIRDNVFGVEILGHASALLRQDLVIGDTGGGYSLAVVDNSHAWISDGVTIASNGPVEVGNQSFIEVDEGQIDTDVVLFRSGKAFMDEAVVSGFVALYDFSTASIDGENVDFVICDETSDASCEPGTVGGVSGCAHCEGPPLAGPVPDLSPNSGDRREPLGPRESVREPGGRQPVLPDEPRDSLRPSRRLRPEGDTPANERARPN